jgi:hypothetical protein
MLRILNISQVPWIFARISNLRQMISEIWPVTLVSYMRWNHPKFSRWSEVFSNHWI